MATMAESLTGLDMVIRWIEGFHLMAESVEDCGWIKGWIDKCFAIKINVTELN